MKLGSFLDDIFLPKHCIFLCIGENRDNMPRTYKRLFGKGYKHHTKENILQALEEIRNSTLSFRKAAQKYGVPKSVLFRHANGEVKKQGGQTVLSAQEECMFIERINICSEWGYPIDCYDLRLIVKNYLDKLGRNEPRFKNNLPGKDFVYSFLKRNKKKFR